MSILDYIPSPAGGSISGFRSLEDRGFVNIATESVWVAVFLYFILYQLLLLLSPLNKVPESKPQDMAQVKEEHTSSTTEQSPSSSTEITATPESQIPTPSGNEAQIPTSSDNSKVYDSLIRIGCSFRDAYLILLGTVLVGMSGFGIYGTSLSLVWLVFALLLTWSFSQLISLSLVAGLIELSSMFITVVLVIIVWGMSYYKMNTSGFS